MMENPDYDDPEGGEWWYMGNPCRTYLAGQSHDGRLCDGIDSHGAPCAPCSKLYKLWLEAHLSFCDYLKDTLAKDFPIWLAKQVDH